MAFDGSAAGRDIGAALNRRRFKRAGKVLVGLRSLNRQPESLPSAFRLGLAQVGPHSLEFEQLRGGPYFGFTVFRRSAVHLPGVQLDVASARPATFRERMRLTPLNVVYRATTDVGELEIALEVEGSDWVLALLAAVS